jgi:hypothetical protein
MPTILFFRVQAQPFGGAKRAMLGMVAACWRGRYDLGPKGRR